MKKSVAVLVTITALSLGALAQAPSPAPTPAPDMQPAAGEGRGMRGAGERGGMGERGRWSGPAGMETREFGLERLVNAIAMGQEFGKKLNLTAEQQELIKRLATEQRTKLVDMQAKLTKAALKQTEVLMADPLDEAALMAAVEETGKARLDIAKAQIQILIDVRKALTEEQRKTLRELMIQAKQQPIMPMRGGDDQRREGRMRGGERGEAPRNQQPPAAPAPAAPAAPAAPPPAPM